MTARANAVIDLATVASAARPGTAARKYSRTTRRKERTAARRIVLAGCPRGTTGSHVLGPRVLSDAVCSPSMNPTLGGTVEEEGPT